MSDALPISHQFHVLKSQFQSPPLYACLAASMPNPKAKPTPVAINKVNAIPKRPVGSYLLTGSFPQYEYKFNPLTELGSKYSTLSGEIHLHNSGE